MMRAIQTAVVSCALGALLGTSVPAFTPSTNGNGVAWVSESAEAWSGDAQTNASGAVVHLVGAFDQSLDASNGAGIVAHLGLLDPISPLLDPPTPTSTLSSTETPTETMLTPTLSLTPTVTPTWTLLALTPTNSLTPTVTPTWTLLTLTPTNSLTPTVTPTWTLLTLTPTNSCLVAEGSYDLTGDGAVDARDLIALLTSIEEGTGLYDLNCDGTTDERDLRAFSAKWKTIP